MDIKTSNQKSFKHQKASNGAGWLSINSRKCKYSHYNERNCKSGRHNQHHSFKRHRPRHKPLLSNITYDGFKVKGRKGYTSPSTCRLTEMLRATISCQDDIICRSTRFKPSLLHFNEFNMNNDHLSTNSEYKDQYIVNFSPQFIPNQVDSTTNLSDEVVLTEVVLRPIEKPRRVGPHKLTLKKMITRGNHS